MCGLGTMSDLFDLYPKRRKAGARFFLRIAGRRRATMRCENTAPLFPLWLILEADGTLARDAQHLVGGTKA